jgi:hypothetical protein
MLFRQKIRVPKDAQSKRIYKPDLLREEKSFNSKIDNRKSHEVRNFWQHHLRPILEIDPEICQTDMFLKFSSMCKQRTFTLRRIECLASDALKTGCKNQFIQVQNLYKKIQAAFKKDVNLMRKFPSYYKRLSRSFEPVISSSFETLSLSNHHKNEGLLLKSEEEEDSDVSPKKINNKISLPFSVVYGFLQQTQNPLLFHKLSVDVDMDILYNLVISSPSSSLICNHDDGLFFKFEESSSPPHLSIKKISGTDLLKIESG